MECTHWTHHVQTPLEPRHQHPGFQAPAGPASGPRLPQDRRVGEGAWAGGLGAWDPLRSRPGPGQWPGRGRQRQQGEPLTPHHSPGQLASITRGSGSSAGHPHPRTLSPRTSLRLEGQPGVMAQVLVRWGQGRARHCPSEQQEDSLQSPPPQTLLCRPHPPPSLFSLLPSSPSPSPSQETERPGAHCADQAWEAHTLACSQGPGPGVHWQGRVRGRGAGQAVLSVWPCPPRCVVRPACERCTPLGTG